MASGILGIGVRSLSAAQLGLVTAQHNIANANVAGFHRQEVVQGTAIPFLTGSGYVGQGAQVETIKRIYSQFLDNQVLSAGGQAKYYEAYHAQVSQIDNLVADPQAGLSPALQDFFRSVQALADNPSSASARQSLLSAGQSLTTRFHSIYDRLSEIRNGVDTQIGAALSDINAYATQIATLNDKIVVAQSVNNQPPNDLLDQREQLIQRLNEQIKATSVVQSDGTINVFVGNGQALVVGNRTYSLSATQDPLDSEQLIIGYSAGSQTVAIPETSLTGGALGGLLAFRRTALDDAQNSLGRVAIGLADTFNTQHKLGQDLNNALGGNFFNLASTTPTLYPSTANTGTAAVSVSIAPSAVGDLTTSSYHISYDGTNYALTDLATNSTTGSLTAAQLTTQLSNVGVTFSITSGSAAAGDEWLLLPTRFGARDISVAITDPNKIAAASPIATAAAAANAGGATISAGSVTATASLPTASVTLTYSSASQTFATTSSDAAWNGLTIPSSGTYTSGATISVNGVSFAITGSPSNGDAFTLGRNTGGVGDNRNALLLGALQSNNTLANSSPGGTATTSYQGAYAQLVSAVGNKTRETQVNFAAQTTLLDQTKAAQQSLSGVNLDEEAANLIKYQQAYQASAKIVQIGSTLLDTILKIS